MDRHVLCSVVDSVDRHVFCSVLASFLPCFVSLQRLYVDSKRDAVFLGLFLQVWPLRYLTDSQMLEPRQLGTGFA